MPKYWVGKLFCLINENIEQLIVIKSSRRVSKLQQWKVPRNWIAFYWNSFVKSPCLMKGDSGGLVNETCLRQILFFLWNNSLTVQKLQTDGS